MRSGALLGACLGSRRPPIFPRPPPAPEGPPSGHAPPSPLDQDFVEARRHHLPHQPAVVAPHRLDALAGAGAGGRGGAE
jgi:hypothetical protein